ncbi:glycosyltransferase family 4 protein [Synechococcus sp. CS-1324]|nr:glycosyltransferase family 4 protein [Synechococcus sp. CS-1324]PZV04899.1 MAG: hypothetical protein DCF23_05020 [Cyanobium sp.]
MLCNGDATDPATWSNIPYFLLQAGITSGWLQSGISLHPEPLKGRKRLWNLAQLIRTGKAGGFQYSPLYAQTLFQQAGLQNFKGSLLSHYPFLPPLPWPSSQRVDFYIDATTRQIFDDYGLGDPISASFRAEALTRERLAYQQAGSVICMAQWTANSVINDYGIDPAKVHVVPGGANLDEARLAELAEPASPPLPSEEAPLRLGFLGKDWPRKGGPFLLTVAEALQRQGIPSRVRAIGVDPARLPHHPLLEPLGFINKQTDTPRFVAELRSWHFGALFSSAEAAPRSNLECLRLGVPLIAHAVGGIPSTLPDAGCGQLFPAHPSASEVANWLVDRLTPYQRYLAWRAALAPRWREFTWAAAVEQLAVVLN